MVHIDVGLFVDNCVAANSTLRAYIYKNGTAFKNGSGESPGAGTTTSVIAQVSVNDACNGTDYYEVFASHDTGANVRVSGDVISMFFTGHAIGGPKGDTGAVGPTAPSWALVARGFRATKGGTDQTGIVQGLGTVYTKITFTTEDYHQGGFYDAPNSRWTPPAGTIHIDVCLYCASASAGAMLRASVYKNEVIFKVGTAAGPGTHTFGQVSFDDVASGTDYYEVYLTHNSTGTIPIFGDTSFTFFSGHLVGGPKGDAGTPGAPGASGSGSGDVVMTGTPTTGQLAAVDRPRHHRRRRRRRLHHRRCEVTLKTVADPGWVMMDDQGIGSAASGAAYANNNAQALFTLLYTNITDTYCPVYTSAGVLTTRAAQGRRHREVLFAGTRSGRPARPPCREPHRPRARGRAVPRRVRPARRRSAGAPAARTQSWTRKVLGLAPGETRERELSWLGPPVRSIFP